MQGLLSGILKLFSKKSQRDVAAITPLVTRIHEEYAKVVPLSNDDLRARTPVLKKRINDYISKEEEELAALLQRIEGNTEMEVAEKEIAYERIDKLKSEINDKIEEILDEILPEAFAIVKETTRRFKENQTIEVTATQFDRDLSTRIDYIIIKEDKAIYHNNWIAGGNRITWDMVHYDVQLIGGVVLHEGKIAEMATGEGKTVVATLPVYLNALAGRGVHIVTVNDYLAKRDSEWMGPIYQFHGLSVDCIDKYQPHSPERKKAYLSDITFGTNNEFGFDYLRDNMANNKDDLVQRGHHYAIVDEVDSVLIDDARTPLIISGPTPMGDRHEFFELKPRVEKLLSAQRNYVTATLASAKKLMEEDKEKECGLALLRCYRGLPKNKALIKFLSEEGVKVLLQKTENYYMQDQSKEMHKVDEELFFVIDEKNNSIELSEKGIDLITESGEDQHFFVIPDVGSQMAEIEKGGITDNEKLLKKEELMREFSIKGERIHTMNQLLKAYTLFEKDVEYVIMEGKVKIVDEQTGRIMEGRRYSDGLHQAIEAKEKVKVEAATQTYATITLQNFFRMYHKLAGMTGTAETEAGEFWGIYKLDVVVIPTNRPIVRQDSNDQVFKTMREKYNAVIEEIVKLTAANRPVLVGTTSVEVSELLSRMLKLRGIKHDVLNAKLHQREADIVAHAGQAQSVTIATNMAGRGTDIKLGAGVKDAGGLAIIGTERHESRRVDRQLRGRSGRQGDPGSSQFYVALEDNLMRLFGSARIANIMDRLGLEEGEMIQHSMVTRSIERAQKKVEENNYGMRKRLLEYDDVMNSQREVIYTKRRHALFGERLSVDIANMMFDVSESISEEYQQQRNYEGFRMELIRVLTMESPVTEEEFFNMEPGAITAKVYQTVQGHYKRKLQYVPEKAFPVIKHVYESQSSTFENIAVPFTDGIKTLQVLVNLKKAYDSHGKELLLAFERGIILAVIDDAWKEHLREMDDLRQSVQQAVYEQKDPLLVYKFESFNLFKQMIGRVNREIVSFLFKGDLPSQHGDGSAGVRHVSAPVRADYNREKANRPDMADLLMGPGRNRPVQGNDGEQQATQPVRVEKKTGRNELCPCGSRKKYKHCHGR